MRGKLYGIGVGPGDPELLTLKAVRLIKEADIVAVPVKKRGEKSVALNIAKAAVEIPEDKIVELEFTMSKDKTKQKLCQKEAARQAAALLDEGKNIAMLALGDIGIYSTYAYVHEILKEEGYAPKMVSGIPSFCEGASKAKLPLAKGSEGFCVLPSFKGIDKIEAALNLFENVIIMKAGNQARAVYELLKKRKIEENAVVVSNCGMDAEYIGKLDPDREYSYFTTIIIKSL